MNTVAVAPGADANSTERGGRDRRSATMVVSFDQPSVATTVAGRVPVAAWNDLPAVSANYGVARDSIKQRVAKLVDSLARAAAARNR